MGLFQAHKEWRSRPADECFASLADLHAVVTEQRAHSVQSMVKLNELKFEYVPDLDEVCLVSQHGGTAVPSHWAFTQLCDNVKADAQWMRRIGSGYQRDLDLVARNLNWATQHAPRERMAMLWANGQRPGIARCFTTPSYARLWDSDVVVWLRNLTQDETNGWHRPPSKTDHEAPKGIYGGDRNIFVFLVNDDNPITDGDGPIYRGFFCWNSEVRQMSFGFKAFLYKKVCGNHIVWGAEELFDLRMVHIGDKMTSRAEYQLNKVLGAYLLSDTTQDQAVISAAQVKTLGRDKAEVIETLTRGRRGLPKWTAAEAKEMTAETERVGKDPTVVWNLVDTATRLSQRKANADERSALDRKAGALLNVVF